MLQMTECPNCGSQEFFINYTGYIVFYTCKNCTYEHMNYINYNKQKIINKPKKPKTLYQKIMRRIKNDR